jgi:hypothetical protein
VTTTENTNGQPAETTVIPTAPEADPSVIEPVATYLADYITGLHYIGLKWVQIAATAGGNVITASLTRRRFDGDDCAAQIPITITIGPPKTIEPAPLPEQISSWSEQILNLWTDGSGPEAAA